MSLKDESEARYQGLLLFSFWEKVFKFLRGGRRGAAPVGSGAKPRKGRRPDSVPPHALRLRWILENNLRLAACMLVAACVSLCAFAVRSSSAEECSGPRCGVRSGNWRSISQGVAYQR